VSGWKEVKTKKEIDGERERNPEVNCHSDNCPPAQNYSINKGGLPVKELWCDE